MYEPDYQHSSGELISHFGMIIHLSCKGDTTYHVRSCATVRNAR